MPIHPLCRFPQDNNPYALVDPQNLPCQPITAVEFLNHTATEMTRGFEEMNLGIKEIKHQIKDIGKSFKSFVTIFNRKMDEMIWNIQNSTKPIKNFSSERTWTVHNISKPFQPSTPPPNYHYYPRETNYIDYLEAAAAIAVWAVIIFGGAYLIKRKFFPAVPVIDQSHRTTPLTPDQAMDKMRKNAEKATTEAIPSKELLEQKETTPLQLKPAFAEEPGPQDAHFFTETEQGTLIGVFGGQGGKEVSNYANQEFQKRFADVLKAHNGDVFRSFEVLIHDIHQEVAQKPEWNSQGSTLVVSFIDKETHQIITATMGTNEANIYRGEQSIPLSLIRDWTSRKDEARLKKAHGKAADRPIWKNQSIPKTLCSRLDKGVTISRAIGLIDETGTKENPLVIHKPKITINKLQKGDILVLGSAGFKETVSDDEIVKTIAEKTAWTIRNITTWIFNWIRLKIFCHPPRGLAHDLVQHASHTVVAIEAS